MRRMTKLGALLSSVAGVALIVSCSGEEDGSTLRGPDSSQAAANTGVSGFNTPGFGSSTVGTAGECQDSGDCDSGETCHPTAFACVTAQGSCTSQTDCTGGTYCDTASNSCLPGLGGSTCASDDNCADASCTAGVCGCSGFVQAQEGMGGPLDIYFMFDRTASMGTDCDYMPGGTPPVNSKACFSTYALPDYLINVPPVVDTRFALQFMSQPGEGCDGSTYSTPQVGLTQLPVAADHQMIQDISNETFEGGYGTEIEGALRGIATYTANNGTPGREMIGVLMTDGDPNGCNNDVGDLAQIIADHLAATGIRTFIIGMDGATEDNLEELAIAGGADPHNDFCGGVNPPCHYWNVGDGSGDAIASALQAIVIQAAPLPCEYAVSNILPPSGMALDLSKINVTLTGTDGMVTTIGQVPSESACPGDQPAWFYDNPGDPRTINLCQTACDLVTNAATGARVSIVGGCQDTVLLR